MKEPTKKAERLATAIRGAKPNTKLKPSSPSQKEAAGNATAAPEYSTGPEVRADTQTQFLASIQAREQIVHTGGGVC